LILVDTSVWSYHFRKGEPLLAALLAEGRVLAHAWVVGELALGPGLRLDVLPELAVLPCVPTMPDGELLDWLRMHRIRGVGWVDAQLLAAALRAGARLWTRDAELSGLAQHFGVDGTPA
jgi:predicted nucleic acid-binding protein